MTKEELFKFDLEKSITTNFNFEEMYPLYNTLEKIRGVHHFIKDTPSSPFVSHSIYREERILAVGGTQRIEGNNIPDDTIRQLLEGGDDKGDLSDSEREIVQSGSAYFFILDYCQGNQNDSISEAVIKQIHSILTKDINYLSNTPGAYRAYGVKFGVPQVESIIQTEADVAEAMNKFVEWLNSPSEGFIKSYPLIRALIAHYYLTEIHPFGDGNGRTARAIEAMILLKEGFNGYCFWSLANFFSINRNEYLQHLRSVRDTNNILPFLTFASNGHLGELRRIKKKIIDKMNKLIFMDYINDLKEHKRRKTIKINQRIFSFLDLLTDVGAISVNNLSHFKTYNILYENVNDRTEARDFIKMQSLGLIKYENDANANGNEIIKPRYEKLNEIKYK